MKRQITIVAAVGRDGAIGRDGDLVFRIREDMRHFRAVTMGHAVVMGRRTYESLPAPLSGRRNIVVTGRLLPGVETATSLAEALAMCADDDNVMIIGGGRLYAAAMPLATRLEITRIDACTPDADTYFPAISPGVWREVSSDGPHTDPATGLAYTFLTLERKE